MRLQGESERKDTPIESLLFIARRGQNLNEIRNRRLEIQGASFTSEATARRGMNAYVGLLAAQSREGLLRDAQRGHGGS